MVITFFPSSVREGHVAIQSLQPNPFPCSVCGPHFEAKFQSLDNLGTILKKIQFQC